MKLLMDKYPALTRQLLDLVGDWFARVLLDLESSSFRHLVPRLASLLLGKADDNFVRDLTHEQIAQHLCVCRESVTAALGEMRKAGVVSIERKRIRIINKVRLERASWE